MTDISSGRTRRGIRPARLVGTVAFSALVVLLASCQAGGTGTTPTAGGGRVPSDVTDSLAQYTGDTSWAPPGDPYDVSSVKGKTVYWVVQGPGNPFLETVGANFAQALKSVGVGVITCNGNYNPVDYARCIDTAVSQGAAAIQFDGGDASTIAAALDGAKKAGIPVLGGDSLDASKPVPDGIAAHTSSAFILGADLMAKWVIADSNGAANSLFITSPDVVGSVQEADSFKATMAKYCPDCKVTEAQVTQQHWATDLGTAATSAVRKDPSITYVVPSFDVMATYTNPAMKLAGLNGKVKMVSSNASLDQMKSLAAGDFFAAEVGQNVPAIGYIEADQLLRVLVRQDPIKNYVAPVRIFTKDDATKLNLTQKDYDSGAWYGTATSLVASFAAHWKTN